MSLHWENLSLIIYFVVYLSKSLHKTHVRSFLYQNSLSPRPFSRYHFRHMDYLLLYKRNMSTHVCSSQESFIESTHDEICVCWSQAVLFNMYSHPIFWDIHLLLKHPWAQFLGNHENVTWWLFPWFLSNSMWIDMGQVIALRHFFETNEISIFIPRIPSVHDYGVWFQASTLTKYGSGPVGPVTLRIYWSCKNFTGPTIFSLMLKEKNIA